MTDRLPWEQEGVVFDAEKAKALILNLRAEKKTLQDQTRAAKDELQETKSAKAALENDLAEAKQQAVEAQRQYEKTTGELAAMKLLRNKEKILADKGLPADIADLLTGDDEEALVSAADRLASLRDGASDEPPGPTEDNRPDPSQVGEPATDQRQEWANELFGS